MDFQTLAKPTLALPRLAKRLIVVAVDTSLCVLTVWLALCLRLGELTALKGNALLAIGMSIGMALPVFMGLGLYRAVFKYSGWPALLTVARAISIYGLLYSAMFTAIGVADVPRTMGIIQPILLFLLVGASRALARLWLGDQYQSILTHASRPKVLIYGAGRAGRQLAAAMAHSQEIQLAGFIDDDDRLHGHMLNNHPIYNPGDLENLVSTLAICSVLLALPSVERKRRNVILQRIRRTRVLVRTLPSLADLPQGKVGLSDVRDLDIDDLLGREQVSPNHILLARNVLHKTVLVTGAGGMIGGELCRQLLSIGPGKLLLIEQSEFALHAIHQELEKKCIGLATVLVPLLASVQDDERMREIMSTWHPDTVYHAAAYKHVPLVEHNPAEGIKNNVLGTLHTAQAAAENGVSDFVLVSTDGAVHSTNIMGASKRLAEMVLQALAHTEQRTKFSVVRFGSVLGSSGSLVTTFRQQIREGGPIAIHHPETRRHFMTLPEAAELIVQAGALAKRGDICALEMGQPVRIIDLARSMIEFSGLSVKDAPEQSGDIAIEFTGSRAGEQQSEDAFKGSHRTPTSHPKIVKVQEDFLPWTELEDKLRALKMALGVNDVTVIGLMMETLVQDYTPGNDIVDWVYMEQEAELQTLGAGA